MPLPALAIPLIAAGVSALGKGIVGARQRRDARNLKMSNYVPEELRANYNLAQMQAFSRRAPGSAKAEENVRRAQANTISAVQRVSGGNVNKVAAAAVASQGQANDAFDRIATQGQAFAENAYARMANANSAIGAQKRQNKMEYDRTKAQLLAASDQNYFSAFNDLINGGMAAGAIGSGATMGGGGGTSGARNPFFGYNNYSNNAFGTIS